MNGYAASVLPVLLPVDSLPPGAPYTCKLWTVSGLLRGLVLFEHGLCCTAGSATDSLGTRATLVLHVLWCMGLGNLCTDTRLLPGKAAVASESIPSMTRVVTRHRRISCYQRSCRVQGVCWGLWGCSARCRWRRTCTMGHLWLLLPAFMAAHRLQARCSAWVLIVVQQRACPWGGTTSYKKAFWRLQARTVPFPGAREKPLNKSARGR